MTQAVERARELRRTRFDRPRSDRPFGLVVAALAVGGFAIGTTEFATMGILPLVSADLGASVPDTGHMISMYALGVVIGAPLFAVLTARLERRAVLVALMAAFGAGNLLSALAPTLPLLWGARFLSGLPHGAYFGIAAVVAATLARPDRRGRAIAEVMLGLTVANIVGVPVATWLGQGVGWRATYVGVTFIAMLTIVAVLTVVPRVRAAADASPLGELRALGNPQVWLTLGIGAIGFGGFFAVYSYVAPTLTTVSGLPLAAVPLVLSLFGVGMTVGTVLGGHLADRSLDRTILVGLLATIATLLLLLVTVHHPVAAALTIGLLGLTGSTMAPALQARLFVVAHDGQNLAATMNHSALNLANAAGAYFGGLVIAAGLGYSSTAVVGVVLAAGGLVVLAVASATARRAGRAPVPA